MALWTRMTTLLRADAHGVVDALEDRGLLMRQHLRDAEAEIDRKRADCEAAREEMKRLDKAIARAEARVEELDSDAQLAIGRQEDDLARFALRRLLAQKRDLTRLARRRQELVEALGERESRLVEQQAQLDALRERVRQRLQVEAERNRLSATDPEVGVELEAPVSDEEVEIELLRRRGRGAEQTMAGEGA